MVDELVAPVTVVLCDFKEVERHFCGLILLHQGHESSYEDRKCLWKVTLRELSYNVLNAIAKYQHAFCLLRIIYRL